MTQKRIFRSCWGFKAALVLFLAISFGSVLSAQAKSIDSMDAQELVKEADFLLRKQEFDRAIPYLVTYLKKFGELDDFRIVRMSQDIRYKLGRILAGTSDKDQAVGYLEDYVSKRPAPDWYDAMKLLSSTLLEVGKLSRCIEVTQAALAGPTNAINPVVQTRDVQEDDERVRYELDESGRMVVVEETDETEAKTGYTVADRVVLNKTLGEAYSDLSKIEESISPFLYVAENDTVGIRRGYAIMKAIEAMVQLKQFDELSRLIPALYQTDARYDIRVNMAIMSAAASLFNAEDYDQALALFRMVLPRQKLIEFQNRRILRLKYDAQLISITDLTREQVIELGLDPALLIRDSKEVVEEYFYERGDSDEGKPPELIELENLVDTLMELDPYEQDVAFRTAYLYDTVDRPWEAVEIFNELWDTTPESELGQRAFLQANRVIFRTLDRGADSVERCYAFLDEHREGLLPRRIAYLLTEYYQKTDQMPSVKQLLPYLKGFVPSEDATVVRYETELYYMQAIADLVMRNYEEAKTGFELVLEKFPGSSQADNSTYWRAMTLMFLQKYDEALPAFKSYLEEFPEGNWVASANYQMGTCLFGMEEYQQAKERLSVVIDEYPLSASYPDALSMRGDILASEEGETKLDEAVADYEAAISAAEQVVDEAPDRSHRQSMYATFQLATVYELLAKAYKSDEYYQKIISVVNHYLDFYGDDANISRGIYWIGKTLVNQGRVDEAVQSYLEAIAKYGGDIEQDGVDPMIFDLVALYRHRLNDVQRAELIRKVQSEAVKSENLTLQLRLLSLVAQLDGTEMEFGKRLISELKDLSVAAPPVLSAISKASFQEKDYSRAKEILDVFKTQFNESQFIRPAYKLRAFDLYESGDFDEAMKVITETQERYGTDKDVAWAQLMKCDLLIQQGKYDEAKEQLLFALSVPEWRGAPYAEATYRLGMAAELAGDPRKAFGWYQRAYFQYKGYADGRWAAEAYLASARCLQKMGRPNDVRNTYRAMLFDRYVNDLPQAEVARKALGPEEVLEIKAKINSGTETNITVTLDAEASE